MSAAVFTSELEIDELLLLEQAGWTCVQVVGGDYPIAPPSWLDRTRHVRWRSTEADRLSEQLTDGWRRAIWQMRREAHRSGASGVVGVRLETTDDGDRWHISASGTAVREARPARGDGAPPFTARLSGSETWALLRAGYRPVGIVVGVSVWHAPADTPGFREVAEMPLVTKIFTRAREAAIARMQAQAGSLRGDGVVGVEIRPRIVAGRGASTVEFTVIGTAIAREQGWTHRRFGVGVSLGDDRQAPR